MEKNSKKISKSIALVLTAVMIIVSLCTSFVAWNITSDDDVKSTLDKDISTAVDAVDSYENSLARNTFLFTDELYSKANLVGATVTEKSTDEELEKLARYLYVDSIMVTDIEGKCVASYPADLKGTNISDNEDTSDFVRVLKGVLFKSQSEPKAVDENRQEYSLYTSVRKADGQGIVVIGSTVSDYDELLGSDIASDCNDNTIIASGDNVISSSFAGSKATLSEMGITEENLNRGEFTIAVDGKEYICKTEIVDEFTVLCFVSNADANSQATIVLVITLVADMIAFAVIAVLLFVLGKRKSA